MEVECGVTPLMTLGETAKDAAVPEDIAEDTSTQFMNEEVTFQQPNGVSDERIPVATNASLDESLKTMLANESETSNFVENLEKSVLDVPVHFEANPSDTQIVKTHSENISTFVSSADSCSNQLTIETVQENPTIVAESIPNNVATAENKNAHKFDTEINNIIDTSTTQSNELASFSESAIEQNTSDLLTQLEGHTEFGENMQENSNISSGDNNNVETSPVLNKKELLDILEGNDQNGNDEISTNENNENIEKAIKDEHESMKGEHESMRDEHESMKDEHEAMKQLVLQQIDTIQCKKSPKKSTVKSSTPKGKSSKSVHTRVINKSSNSSAKKKFKSSDKKESNLKTDKVEQSDQKNEVETDSKANRSKELIKVLVEDWDDDDINDCSSRKNQPDTPSTAVGQTDIATCSPVNVDAISQTTEKQDINEEKVTSGNMSDSSSSQRRVSRVIKKKVIFDPDNPDTFTSKKAPVAYKSKSPQSNDEQKEHPSLKKTKVDVVQCKTKEKSPTLKQKPVTQWKKPPPKNHKRLTEVDKLLMDEGAVNMMYQLNTSGDADTPKIKKNIRSKAAFIKKLNQKTPDSNEIKFRERKSIKAEEITSGKRESRSRTSTTSGAMSSPATCDQYEAHTADDSVIIRRHSSSSYSSSCLSPRRLSDIEMSTISTASASQSTRTSLLDSPGYDKFNDVFMSDTSETKQTSVLDRNDCLSLKEKLNLKLSRALNIKRKREMKTEVKQKKLKDKKIEDSPAEPELQMLSVKYEERVAEINILKAATGNATVYNIDTLRELTKALDYIDGREDISVTLLLASCGDLCGGLDLSSFQQHSIDTKPRLEAAGALADAVRSLFVCMERHSKFMCAGVEGICVGLGLSLLALCDVVLASDRANFRLLGSMPCPGVSVLTSHRKSLCRSLVTEMLVFGRQLSASEALSRGLVSRTLWPDRYCAELHATVKDIAAQPPQALLLKKRLLGLRNNVKPDSTFLSCLDAERDLLAAYWASNDCSAENN